MSTEKQKWVEHVLESANNILTAKSPDLTGRILDRIGSAKQLTISPKNDNSLIWKMAASIIFITLLNALTLYSYQNNEKRSMQVYENKSAAAELGLTAVSSDPGSVIFGK